jgi:hypothetical protein
MSKKVYTVVLEVTVDEASREPKDWNWKMIQDKVLFVDAKRRMDIEEKQSKAI